MTRPLLSLFIGLRYSCGRHYSSMMSFTSIVSIISITIGVSVLIISLSAVNGFKRELNNRILAVVPHGEIEAINQPWRKWNEVIKKIEKVPGIIAIAPYINFTGLVMNEGSALLPIQIKGVIPQYEERLSALPEFVQGGAWKFFKDSKQQIIIGKGVINALKLRNGDWISIMIPNVRATHKLQQPKYIRLHIIGILQLNGQLDHNFALVPLKDANQYLDMENSITGIAIKVSDVFHINELMYNLSKIISNYHVYVKSWISTYGYMYYDIQMIRATMYLAMLLLIGVACFNIVSTLIMTAKSKSDDIAILRTLGAKDNLIRAIFVWYGLLVGMIGSVCGMTIGIIVSSRLTLIVNKIEKLIGYRFLSGDIYFVDFLPSELHWKDVMYTLLVALLLSLLASWYPARRASHIDPVKVLKSSN